MPKRPSKPHFLRFEQRGTGQGLFTVLDTIRDYQRWGSCVLPDETVDRVRVGVLHRHESEIENARAWLFRHTVAPEPEHFRIDSQYRQPRCWFVPTATEHQRHAWRLCHILNLANIPLRPIWAVSPPGEVLYEDPVQVVIRPDRGVIKPTHNARRRIASGWSGSRRTIRHGSGLHWMNVRTNPLRKPEDEA